MGKVLLDFSKGLESNRNSDIASCLEQAIKESKKISKEAEDSLLEFGVNLGHFDVFGQVRDIEAVCDHCQKKIQEIETGKEERIRTYRTLGFCAGAALAIMLM